MSYLVLFLIGLALTGDLLLSLIPLVIWTVAAGLVDLIRELWNERK